MLVICVLPYLGRLRGCCLYFMEAVAGYPFEVFFQESFRVGASAENLSW